MILLGELPELEETQSGKDLIRIGEARGDPRRNGTADSLPLGRAGRASAAIRAPVRNTGRSSPTAWR
jgi:hypothetical protein